MVLRSDNPLKQELQNTQELTVKAQFTTVTVEGRVMCATRSLLGVQSLFILISFMYIYTSGVISALTSHLFKIQ